MKRYPGTLPFTTADKDLFFGRQKEMAELYQLISLKQIVVLYGKSGLGKSSLIQAGIIPKIGEAETYQPIYIRFTANNNSDAESPTETTKKIIGENFDAATFLQKIKADEDSLWATAKNRQINGGKYQLVLFFDQFEELFSYSEKEIQHYLRELRELVGTAIPQRIRDELNQFDDDFLTAEEEDTFYETLDIKVIFSIRSDRMHLMNKLSRNLPEILANNYELQPLSLADAKISIVLPAQAEGNFDSQKFTYSDDALAKILNFLKDEETQRVEAFQLQLLCQTFEQKVENEGVNEINISAVGDLENVIGAYFQNSLMVLSETDRNLVNLLIAKELVSPDGNIRYSIFEQKLKTEYFISDELLNQLIDLRLLRREKTSRGVIYEISHDTFIKSARTIQIGVKREEEQLKLAKAEAEIKVAKERADEQERLRQKAEKAEGKAKRSAKRSRIIAIAAVALAVVAVIFFFDAEKSKKRAGNNLFRAAVIAQHSGEKPLFKNTSGETYDFRKILYEKIDTLGFDSWNIDNIHEYVFLCKNLLSLKLSGNKLKILPEDIGKLTNLTELSLSDNKLKILPKEIGQLTDLTKLDLSGNKLKILPKEIGQLTDLTELGLIYNKLEILPKEIGQLINLTELDLRDNSLKILPKEIGQLTNLTELDLRYNLLSSLPAQIGQLTNLTKLDLIGNKFSEEERKKIEGWLKESAPACKIYW
jgi:energy-coupling factor transporter ATP-binding protein EcfA2